MADPIKCHAERKPPQTQFLAVVRIHGFLEVLHIRFVQEAPVEPSNPLRWRLLYPNHSIVLSALSMMVLNFMLPTRSRIALHTIWCLGAAVYKVAGCINKSNGTLTLSISISWRRYNRNYKGEIWLTLGIERKMQSRG